MQSGSKILSVRKLQPHEGIGLHIETDDDDKLWVNFHMSLENLVSLGDVPFSLKNAIVRVFAYCHEFKTIYALIVREDGAEIQWRLADIDFSQGDMHFMGD